jgi:hypothetical protein
MIRKALAAILAEVDGLGGIASRRVWACTPVTP